LPAAIDAEVAERDVDLSEGEQLDPGVVGAGEDADLHRLG
jgi:hypothetical protein